MKHFTEHARIIGAVAGASVLGRTAWCVAVYGTDMLEDWEIRLLLCLVFILAFLDVVNYGLSAVLRLCGGKS